MCLFVIKQSNIIHREQHHLQPRNQQYLDYDCVGSIVQFYVATNCTDIVFFIGGFSDDTLGPTQIVAAFLRAFKNYQIYIHLLQENKHLGSENI